MENKPEPGGSMQYERLSGRRLAVIGVALDENGQPEGSIYAGVAEWDQGHLFLYQDDEEPFQIPDDALERIRPVPSEIVDTVLGAEFYLTLAIAPVPEEQDTDDGSDLDGFEPDME
jgi:hypothetical protein